MSFNLADFVTDNLISGYQNGIWATEQVSIFAASYLMRGQITQDHFDRILETVYPQEVDESEVKA